MVTALTKTVSYNDNAHIRLRKWIAFMLRTFKVSRSTDDKSKNLDVVGDVNEIASFRLKTTPPLNPG